jgi:hypothetical protein
MRGALLRAQVLRAEERQAHQSRMPGSYIRCRRNQCVVPSNVDLGRLYNQMCSKNNIIFDEVITRLRRIQGGEVFGSLTLRVHVRGACGWRIARPIRRIWSRAHHFRLKIHSCTIGCDCHPPATPRKPCHCVVQSPDGAIQPGSDIAGYGVRHTIRIAGLDIFEQLLIRSLGYDSIHCVCLDDHWRCLLCLCLRLCA